MGSVWKSSSKLPALLTLALLLAAGCRERDVPKPIIESWERQLIQKVNTDRRLKDTPSLKRIPALDSAAAKIAAAELSGNSNLEEILSGMDLSTALEAGAASMVFRGNRDNMPEEAYGEFADIDSFLIFEPVYNAVGIALKADGNFFGLAFVAALLADSAGGEIRPTITGDLMETELLEPYENRLFDRVNNARTDAGRGKLKLDLQLRALARAYAEKMLRRGFFDHEEPSGINLPERATGSNLEKFALWGENLASLANPEEPTLEAHRGLMDSPGHRRNILDSRFTHLGVGAASDGRWWIFVQLFGQKRGGSYDE